MATEYPTFANIALPQDMQIVGQDGRLSPAWHRVFQIFVGFIASYQRLSANGVSLDGRVETAEAEIDAVEARTSALEDNLGQAALADVSASLLSFSAIYDQTEIEALDAERVALAGKVDSILAALRAAKIIQE